MKALACLLLAATIAFGSPPALGQQGEEKARDEALSPEPSAPVQRPDQILYKGVVGNLLEAVPMDPEKRVELQRGNALVSAPFSARSLALLLGITNPVVLIGGLAWGIWAASRIESPAAHARAPEDAARARVDVAVEAAAGD